MQAFHQSTQYSRICVMTLGAHLPRARQPVCLGLRARHYEQVTKSRRTVS